MAQSTSVPQDVAAIPPYGGGPLVNAIDDASAWTDSVHTLPTLEINAVELFDLLLLGTGSYSPLEGFMDQAAYQSVIDRMALPNGLPWSIPITLSTTPDVATQLSPGQTILLTKDQTPVGTLTLTETYPATFEAEMQSVFQTTDSNHPGVAALMKRGAVYLAGPVRVFIDNIDFEGKDRYLPPAASRQYFQEKGWRTVVGFQTRNPVHRAHEYLLKCALETVDGLFLHPLVGETKADDIPAAVRLQCYDALLESYYNPKHAVLGTYPAAMRYAGPKEALLHAIVRQNHGCTHFIVGRDHAGVGNYYGTYDAQHLLRSLASDKLAIRPLMSENAFYCYGCGQLVTSKTCPHPAEQHLFLSGTRVRELLTQGEDLPTEFTRPEVAEILRRAYQA